jgi:hypothetical protein
MKSLFISTLLFLYSCSIFAYEFEFGDIQIPIGFEGPTLRNKGKSFHVTAFARPHSDGTSSLLQVSIWDPGQKLPLSSEEDFEQASSYYLLEFLSGEERSATEFNKSEIEIISISDFVVAKIKWTGIKFNREMHGTMYCFIHESKIVQLHTQDFIEYEGEYLLVAENAFETIKNER